MEEINTKNEIRKKRADAILNRFKLILNKIENIKSYEEQKNIVYEMREELDRFRMFRMRRNINTITEEKDMILKKWEDFLKELKNQKICEEKKKCLYEEVIKLEETTEKQRNRFLLYYGLYENKKPLLYKEIATIYNCSANTVRDSVLTIKIKMLKKRKEFLKKKLFEKDV